MLADVGIPMIFVQWPLMFAALIPIIVLEFLLIRRWVLLSDEQAIGGMALANLLSTLVGIPLAWLAMFGIEMGFGLAADKWHWKLGSPVLEGVYFVLTSAWIAPYNTYWTIPAAAAVLLIPCFYVSVWIERRVCLRAWPAADRVLVRRGVFLANLASYGVLLILACAWLIYQLLNKTTR